MSDQPESFRIRPLRHGFYERYLIHLIRLARPGADVRVKVTHAEGECIRCDATLHFGDSVAMYTGYLFTASPEALMAYALGASDEFFAKAPL